MSYPYPTVLRNNGKRKNALKVTKIVKKSFQNDKNFEFFFRFLKNLGQAGTHN